MLKKVLNLILLDVIAINSHSVPRGSGPQSTRHVEVLSIPRGRADFSSEKCAVRIPERLSVFISDNSSDFLQSAKANLRAVY